MNTTVSHIQKKEIFSHTAKKILSFRNLTLRYSVRIPIKGLQLYATTTRHVNLPYNYRKASLILSVQRPKSSIDLKY